MYWFFKLSRDLRQSIFFFFFFFLSHFNYVPLQPYTQGGGNDIIGPTEAFLRAHGPVETVQYMDHWTEFEPPLWPTFCVFGQDT